MICLIDIEASKKDGLLSRIRRALTGADVVMHQKTSVFGMPVLRVTVPVPMSGRTAPRIRESALRRRLEAAVACMRRCRIRRVVFSRDFPYREQILREGFEEADGNILTELLAGDIACCVCPEGKAAALFTGPLSASAVKALWKLSASFRHVFAVTPSDGRALYAAIGKKYGMSVISDPSPGQLLKADVALIFGPVPDGTVLSETCVAVPIGGVSPGHLKCGNIVSDLKFGIETGREVEPLQENFPQNILLACALEAGALHPEDIRIESARTVRQPSATWYG